MWGRVRVEVGRAAGVDPTDWGLWLDVGCRVLGSQPLKSTVGFRAFGRRF